MCVKITQPANRDNTLKASGNPNHMILNTLKYMARFLISILIKFVQMRKTCLLKPLVIITLCLLSFTATAQNYQPGTSYPVGPFVEYLDGNIPLIISVPHGGYDKPDHIPEREGRVARNQDIYTIEIARIIYEEIHHLTGSYPYIVINHLHRTRLDVNRDIQEAAGGNPEAEKVWHCYQSRLDSISTIMEARYGKGLFIDLHGHRHKIEHIELGYLMSAGELELDDEMLNSGLLNEFSSIRSLLESNKNDLEPADLIRGNLSLGSILYRKGQAVVPCTQSPAPLPGEPYFRGGYNTTRHGSSKGGSIDGIQIEMDLQTRSDKLRQKKVAEDIAGSLIEFLETHYSLPW